MIRYTDEYISRLLGKFMDGTSSIEEEDTLGEYFRTQKTKPEWEEYRRMFAYFDGGMELPLPAEHAPQPAGQAPQGTRGHRGSVGIFAAAAVAAVCVMLFTLLPTGDNGKQTVQAVPNPVATETAKKHAAASTSTTEARETPPTLSVHSVEPQETKPAANRKKPDTRTPKGNAATSENTGGVTAGEMNELQKAETELERIHNEIAEYNSEVLMAQAALYGMTDEVTEERSGSGDAQDYTVPGINYIRTMTMQ